MITGSATRRARRAWKRPTRTAAIVFLAAALTLGLGFLLKDQCSGVPWESFDMRALCFNDVYGLYWGRHMDTDAFPYADHPNDNTGDPDVTHRWGFNEYPVLTGLVMWTAARLGTLRSNVLGTTETQSEYFYWQAALLTILALATVALLLRMVGDRRRVALFAAGTPLLLYAYHNYDALPVFFVTLGLYWFERDRPALSGAAFALGASAKLYPLLLAPLLFLALVRRRYPPKSESRTLARIGRALTQARDAWRFAIAGAVTFLAINLPFLVAASRELYWTIYRTHLERGPNHESLWWVFSHYGRKWNLAWLRDWDEATMTQLAEGTQIVVFLVAFAFVAWGLWSGRWDHRAALFLVLLAVLATNKFLSVQYALWLLPFFALVSLPIWTYATYAATDLWVHVTVFAFIPSFGGPIHETNYQWLSVALLARAAAYVALFVLVVQRRGAPAETERAAGAGTPTVRATWTSSAFLFAGCLILLASYYVRSSGVDPPFMYPQLAAPYLWFLASTLFLTGTWIALARRNFGGALPEVGKPAM